MSKSDCSLKSANKYHLILFVSGDGLNSNIAKMNLARICENELAGHCISTIVDVLEDFSTAARNNILVTPTLLICKPEPSVTLIGNLSDHGKVLAALRLKEDKS
jgi:circadian clock protein KaiB